MGDWFQKRSILREQELAANVDNAVFGLDEAFRVMPTTVEEQIKISKLSNRFPEVFQPFLSFIERAVQAATCSSHTSSICEDCASNLSSTANLKPGDLDSSSDSRTSRSRCSAAMSSRDAENGLSSTNASSPKLFAVDSDILDRFEDRVSRIEFSRSIGPTDVRTILHISPKDGVSNA